jgi:DNA repair exonuclease SbcCD ATPase subunit
MSWNIEITNVAGILDGGATIEPGINAVRASNWQGKSSFVEAVKGGLGVSTTLTEGEERGSVQLRTPEEQVEVGLRRENGTVTREGEPYLTDEYDAVRAELFACLDETNAVRRAVREAANLEGVLLRPLDFENIDQRIADLKHEREQVQSELAGAKESKKRLPSLTEKVNRLEDELASLREQQAELAEGEDAVQSAQSDLAQARSERDRAENRIERLEASIERTESRLEERRAELADIDIEEGVDVEDELAAARDALEAHRGDLDLLQSLYSATEMVLDEERIDLVTDVNRSVVGDTVDCWTCGSTVDRERIEGRLDELGDRIAQQRAAVESRQDTVEELEARREERKRARRRKHDLEDEITDLEATLSDKRQDLEAARERREAAVERIEDLADTVEDTVAEVTDIESEIKYREAELKDARDEREALQSRADRVDTLSAEYDRLSEEIESLRNRKDEITYETRDAFDGAMADILDRFDTGFESARLTPEFDLAVARDGQETSLDALSEGELELLGFVTALAGYEAFDVAETVPIMLVDGVGGLDDSNLHTLIEYLRERTTYLVFTVYPEYTAFDGHEIEPGDWTIATQTAQ